MFNDDDFSSMLPVVLRTCQIGCDKNALSTSNKCRNLLSIYQQFNRIDLSSNIISRPMQSGDTRPNSKYYQEKYLNIAQSNHPHFIYILWLQLNPEYLVLESFLYPIPDLSNFLNPNHVLNTLISPGYLLINSHLYHIAPLFVPQASKFQNGVTR